MTVKAMTLAQQEHVVGAAHPEPSFTSLPRLESLKASKRLMMRLSFGIMTLAMAGIHLGAYLVKIVFEVGSAVELAAFLPPHIVEDTFFLMSMLGPILMIVMAAGMAGSEYGWGTIRTLVATGVNRRKLLAAKLVLLVAAGVLLTLSGFATAMVTSTAISLIEGQGLGFDWISLSRLGELLLMIARNSFVISVIGIVMGFMPAQLARSVAAGIGVGVGALVLTPLLYLMTGALGSAGD